MSAMRPSQCCSHMHSQLRLPATFPVKPKITHAAEQCSGVFLERLEWEREWEREPGPADSCLQTEETLQQICWECCINKSRNISNF